MRGTLEEPGEAAILGAFLPDLPGGTLAGSVGVFRDLQRKAAHKARIWGMYVRPARRGAGLGAALLTAALEHARALPGVTHVHLGVSESAEAALRLYRRHGFEVWGTEPAALSHSGTSVAEHHLVLRVG